MKNTIAKQKMILALDESGLMPRHIADKVGLSAQQVSNIICYNTLVKPRQIKKRNRSRRVYP